MLQGNIAIDDLQFSDGYCATVPPTADRSQGSTTRPASSVSTSTSTSSSTTTAAISHSTRGSTQTSTVTGRPATRGELIMHVFRVQVGREASQSSH